MNKNKASGTQFDGVGYATPTQAADYFRVSRFTIERWGKACNAIIRDGRIVRFDVAKIECALRAGELSR